MNKKNSFIFLILGIIMFILFAIYNYTDLFKEKNNTIPIETPENEVINGLKYDYVKTHDITKKNRVKFPLIDNLIISKLFTNEYSKNYSNEEGLYFTAKTIETEMSLDNYAKSAYEKEKKDYTEYGYNIQEDSIDCKYKCQKIRIGNEKEFIDELVIYIKSSDIDIVELKYQSTKNISEEFINKVLSNIIITNDASYTIGKTKGNKLNINLVSSNKSINIILNSNEYEEIENSINTTNVTTIKNKSSNSHIILKIKETEKYEKILNTIDAYFIKKDKDTCRRKLKIGDNIFYQYNTNGSNNYAYIINDNMALLIETNV